MSTPVHQGQKLLAAYRKLGLRRGDVVFIHAQLFAFKGIRAADKNEFVRIFLDPLMKAIEFPYGTIVAITYTTAYSSFGTPYIHEKTPTEAGILPEYVRTMRGAVRSFHPLGSVAAIGAKKRFICERISRSQFGWNSVYHRLHQLNAKCLYLGMTLSDTCTFMHYVEHLYGVSHCYHKAFFHPAYYRGRRRTGPFLGFLRNRKSEPYDFSRFARHMKRNNLVREIQYQGSSLQVVRFEDCFREGMKVLDRDPCFFIKRPFYVTE